MGVMIRLCDMKDETGMISRLKIYNKELQNIVSTKSVSKELANSLLEYEEKRRGIKLEQIFNHIIDMYPDGVVIQDIDIMFNPNYKVDVMKIMIEARKRKEFSVIWPGRQEGMKLIYGEEDDQDYKVFQIEDYDIAYIN